MNYRLRIRFNFSYAADIIIAECYRFNKYVNKKGSLTLIIAVQLFNTYQAAINQK